MSAVGLGTSLMSIEERHDDARSIRAIRDAVEAGITLVDTAHAYTTLDEPTHSEHLVREALTGLSARDHVVVATKGGHWRRGDADFPIDGRPETLRLHLEASLRALGVEAIDLYQLHHPDPAVPIEVSAGALAEFQDAGLVRMIGLSNVDRALLDRARSVAIVASVQNHLSPFRIDDLALLEHLDEQGIAFLSHSPFGGSSRTSSLAELLPETARLAEELGSSVQQVILAWQLTLSPSVIPVAGARRSSSILASAAATLIHLDTSQRRRVHDEVVRLHGRDSDA